MQDEKSLEVATTTTTTTAAVAAAAQSKALVEARFLMAERHPRDWDGVRERILSHCRRTKFAEAAIYRRPVGDGKSVTGLSIRAAETTLREMGNIFVDAHVIHEDEDKRIVHIQVTDLEGNSTYGGEVLVKKVVERRGLKQGQQAIGSRMNSSGQMVYLVQATEDEVANKQGSLLSKVIRNEGLRLLPADIKEEMLELILATCQAQDERDPTAARKGLLDAFAGLGVKAEALRDYLGGEIPDPLSPAVLAELRQVYAALRDAETSWLEVIRTRREERAEKGEKPQGDDPAREAVAAKARAASGNGRRKRKAVELADEPPHPAEEAEEAAPKPEQAQGGPREEKEPLAPSHGWQIALEAVQSIGLKVEERIVGGWSQAMCQAAVDYAESVRQRRTNPDAPAPRIPRFVEDAISGRG